MNDIPQHSAKDKATRPLLVTQISILLILSSVQSLSSLYSFYSGSMMVETSERRFMTSLTTLDHIVMGVIAIGNLIGAGLLFKLRRQVVYLFGIGCAVGFLSIIYHVIIKDRRLYGGAWGLEGLVGEIISYGLLSLIFFYSYRLMHRGVLK